MGCEKDIEIHTSQRVKDREPGFNVDRVVLELGIDRLRNGKGALVQDCSQYPGAGILQVLNSFSCRFPTRSIGFKDQNHSFGSPSQHNAVAAQSQRGSIDQNIFEVLAQFR